MKQTTNQTTETEPADRIPLDAIESSYLASAGYDAARQLLDIEFSNGVIFRYATVPLQTIKDFLDAPSKGRFFARSINRRFPAERMTGECSACGAKPGWIGTVCRTCGKAPYGVGGGKR